MIRSGTLAVLATAAVAGCAVGPNYHTPKLDVPASYEAPTPASAVGAATVEASWWESFHDAELTSLVTRAISANLDLQIALSRLQEARTEEAVAVGLALPEVGAGGATARGSGTDLTRGRIAPALSAADNRSGTQVTQVLGFDADWEIDLFGKLRREIEAVRADAQAAAAARNQVLVSLIADVARTYIDLRGLQMRAAALGRGIDAARQTVDYVRARYDNGLTNELDVTLAERELATLQAEAAPLDAQIDAARDAIAVLIGTYPEALAQELAKPAMIPTLPASVQIGAPAGLLQQRPDVVEAERDLAGATARIGVATADLFPRIDLTGALGWQGLAADVGKSAQIWSFGPSFTAPILDFGVLDGRVDVADLRSKEFLLAYKRTVLEAVQQVDTAGSNFAAEQNSLHSLDRALAASQRSVTLASQRYDRGLTDFLNVLDAQRQEYLLQDQYAATDQAAGDALVSVFKALGGGWENFQSVPPIHQPEPAVVAAFQRLLDPGGGQS